MKKTISLVGLLSTILIIFSGCNGKWEKADPNMPEEFIQQQESILNENLEILEKDPSNVDAQFEVALRYQQLGQYKNAEKAYKEVLKIDKNHYVVRNNLADIYEQVEEYDLAVEQILKVYELKPEMTESIRDVVRILLKADQPELAQATLEDFAVKQGGTGDQNALTVISQLFQSIYSYNQQHEN